MPNISVYRDSLTFIFIFHLKIDARANFAAGCENIKILSFCRLAFCRLLCRLLFLFFLFFLYLFFFFLHFLAIPVSQTKNKKNISPK
tara:strand:- start:924 stop:1184 length:261 start_codon:yes stop_codon:yes gene_type:complete